MTRVTFDRLSPSAASACQPRATANPTAGASAGRVVNVRAMGVAGPGVTRPHLEALQRAADQDQIPYVVFGSRQTGRSIHTGQRFTAKSDLDLGVIGADAILKADSWEAIPDVGHAPMRVFDTVAEALREGCVVVVPARR